MENQQKTFKWTLENFTSMSSHNTYLENFSLSGHEWRLMLLPKWSYMMSLVVVSFAGNHGKIYDGWGELANIKVTIANQINEDGNKVEEIEKNLNSESYGLLLSFYRGEPGLVWNDIMKIEVEVSIQPVPSRIGSNPSSAELVDFCVVGNINSGGYIPLLDKVIGWHPIVLQFKRKRSDIYKTWAFTALGNVLHFLSTKRVRDLDDNNFCSLKGLWEELQTFESDIDVSWLTPHIDIVLGMKPSYERTVGINKSREALAAAEADYEQASMDCDAFASSGADFIMASYDTLMLKMLISKKDAASALVDVRRFKLNKDLEGFEEIDLDMELGYKGGPSAAN